MLLRVSLLATLGYAKLEGDIIFTPPQVEVLKAEGYNVDGLTVAEGDGSRAMSVDTMPFQKRWTQAIGFAGPHLRIPFRFVEAPYGFSAEEEAFIRDKALAEVTEMLGGCIEFYDDTHTKLYNDKYIVMRQKKFDLSNEGCSSFMGMSTEAYGTHNGNGGKYQTIRLGQWCLGNLFDRSTIQHEMYHALGFAHEQNRNDRDGYINVLYDNIDPDNQLWFHPLGHEWYDSGDRYDINSVMQYGAYAFALPGKDSMTVKGSGLPVNPNNNGYVTSTDIIQLHKMYQNFCPNRPATLDCANGDYFLAGRECDGFPDCPDGSDEQAGYCDSYDCPDRFIISSPADHGFEGVYQKYVGAINGKVAYQRKGQGPVLFYNIRHDIWQIHDFQTGDQYNADDWSDILAWGLNYDRTCPQGADETWQLEGEDSKLEGFKMKSDYEPKPTPPPSEKVYPTGGNANGAPCHFPFSYFGYSYTKCTTAGGFDFLWCSTTAEYDGSGWGACPAPFLLDGTCFEDSNDRVLKTHIGDFHDDNSKEFCIAACEGYKYAGTQYGYQCFCGDDEPDTSLERPGECNVVCPGNANEKCGDAWRMNIYDTDVVPPVALCQDHPVYEHPELGGWKCDTNSDTGNVRCVHKCKAGNYKTGAVANCKTTGSKQGTWTYHKKWATNRGCFACSAPPNSLSEFSLEGGSWNCNYKKPQVRCKATCANKKRLPGDVFCGRNLSPIGSDNDWKTKKPENYWTCDIPPTCQESDIAAKMVEAIGDHYTYDSEDFVSFGEGEVKSEFKLSGFLHCPHNGIKMARNVWFMCKVNKWGKEVWRFTGDPAWEDSDPSKIKCRAKWASYDLINDDIPPPPPIHDDTMTS